MIRSGRRYGRWVVMGSAPSGRWVCECACGRTVTLDADELREDAPGCARCVAASLPPEERAQLAAAASPRRWATPRTAHEVEAWRRWLLAPFDPAAALTRRAT